METNWGYAEFFVATNQDTILYLYLYFLYYVFSFQIYTHLNNVFELLSKAVVESKQKVNIPKLSKEEPEEKEESEKPKKEERGMRLLPLCYNLTGAWWIFQKECQHFHTVFHLARLELSVVGFKNCQLQKKCPIKNFKEHILFEKLSHILQYLKSVWD